MDSAASKTPLKDESVVVKDASNTNKEIQNESKMDIKTVNNETKTEVTADKETKMETTVDKPIFDTETEMMADSKVDSETTIRVKIDKNTVDKIPKTETTLKDKSTDMDMVITIGDKTVGTAEVDKSMNKETKTAGKETDTARTVEEKSADKKTKLTIVENKTVDNETKPSIMIDKRVDKTKPTKNVKDKTADSETNSAMMEEKSVDKKTKLTTVENKTVDNETKTSIQVDKKIDITKTTKIVKEGTSNTAKMEEKSVDKETKLTTVENKTVGNEMKTSITVDKRVDKTKPPTKIVKEVTSDNEANEATTVNNTSVDEVEAITTEDVTTEDNDTETAIFVDVKKKDKEIKQAPKSIKYADKLAKKKAKERVEWYARDFRRCLKTIMKLVTERAEWVIEERIQYEEMVTEDEVEDIKDEVVEIDEADEIDFLEIKSEFEERKAQLELIMTNNEEGNLNMTNTNLALGQPNICSIDADTKQSSRITTNKTKKDLLKQTSQDQLQKVSSKTVVDENVKSSTTINMKVDEHIKASVNAITVDKELETLEADNTNAVDEEIKSTIKVNAVNEKFDTAAEMDVDIQSVRVAKDNTTGKSTKPAAVVSKAKGEDIKPVEARAVETIDKGIYSPSLYYIETDEDLEDPKEIAKDFKMTLRRLQEGIFDEAKRLIENDFYCEKSESDSESEESAETIDEIDDDLLIDNVAEARDKVIETDCVEVKNVCEEYQNSCEMVKKDCEVVEKDCEDGRKEREGVTKDCEGVEKDGESVGKESEGIKKDCEDAQKDCEGVKQECEGITKDCEDVKKDCEDVKIGCKRNKMKSELPNDSNINHFINVATKQKLAIRNLKDAYSIDKKKQEQCSIFPIHFVLVTLLGIAGTYTSSRTILGFHATLVYFICLWVACLFFPNYKENQNFLRFQLLLIQFAGLLSAILSALVLLEGMFRRPFVFGGVAAIFSCLQWTMAMLLSQYFCCTRDFTVLAKS